MRAILHSFAYPLKPLTQASISIQPIPILHATHNNVLPCPGVSHPESFSAAISIWTSHIRNPSAPPFHLDVSRPESFCAVIPSGCLTPGIPPLPPSSLVSHSRISSAPPFHPGVSHLESFCAAITSGCLMSGILLLRHSPGVSHSRNSSPSPFHPDVSHPELYLADFPPFPDISHPEFCPADGPPFSSSLEHFL